MTSQAGNAIEAVLARVDFLANRGAVLMRAAAFFAWAGAIAATLAAFSILGWPGWIVGLAALFPGWLLWRYGDKLANALDVDRIRGQLGEVADLAKTRLVEVVEGIQETRRQPIRGGFKVLKLVRGLRGDLDSFGVDIAGISEISNPGSLLIAAFSLGAGLALWLTAAVGVVLRLAL